MVSGRGLKRATCTSCFFTINIAEVEIVFPEAATTTVTVNSSDAVDLSCGARGSPAPTFTWFIGSQRAEESQVSSVSEGDAPDYIYVNSTLSFNSTTPQDRNTYTCVASNTVHGEETNDSRDYSLIVNCEFLSAFVAMTS